MDNIIFDKEKVLIVPIDSVQPNDWNPKDKDTQEYQTVRRSLELKGQRQPVYVRKVGKVFQIIDGEQRWTAAKDLGWKSILIYDATGLSDQEAQELTLWFEVQVPFNHLKVAKMVSGMFKTYDMPQVPYTDLQVVEFQKMADFDFSQYNSHNTEDNSQGNENDSTMALKLTHSDWEVISQAIRQVKESHKIESDSEALRIICEDYMQNYGQE